MKNLPKIEKKHLIGAGALATVALVAFLLGTMKSETVAVANPAHEPDEGKPATAHSIDRAPATTPSKESAPEDGGELYEEEVDTQVAHGKHAAPSEAKHVDAKHVDSVVETESAPLPKEDRRGFFARTVGTYIEAWESVNAKVRAIQQTDEENKKLKLENAYLRVMVETGRFNTRSEEAHKKTETVGKKLATEAGSRAARSLASIRYQYPENLLPEQLLALGVGYFKVKDDEKAAVILNFLTELEDDKSFRTASNYLMAGIAFYRLEHFKNAGEYFERIGKLTETDSETMRAKRQALYWQALVAERTKNRKLAQKLILDGLEKDPHTKEARWLNPQGVSVKNRLPASAHSESTHPKKETEESHEGPTLHHQ